MVKNQHLLGGLVLFGAINLLTFFGLMSGERDSARGLKQLEREFTTARDELRRGAESQSQETAKLRRDLEEAQSNVIQLRDDVDKTQMLLAKTRKALEALEERLNTPRPGAGGKEAGQ